MLKSSCLLRAKSTFNNVANINNNVEFKDVRKKTYTYFKTQLKNVFINHVYIVVNDGVLIGTDVCIVLKLLFCYVTILYCSCGDLAPKLIKM